jgi:hypothetical protein
MGRQLSALAFLREAAELNVDNTLTRGTSSAGSNILSTNLHSDGQRAIIYLTNDANSPDTGPAVTGQSEYVLVPRVPTKAMIDAAWAEALAEDAFGVWKAMIEQYEGSISIGQTEVP